MRRTVFMLIYTISQRISIESVFTFVLKKNNGFGTISDKNIAMIKFPTCFFFLVFIETRTICKSNERMSFFVGMVAISMWNSFQPY